MAEPLSQYERYRVENALHVAMIQTYNINRDAELKTNTYIH